MAIRSVAGSAITSRPGVTIANSGWRTSCTSPLDIRTSKGSNGDLFKTSRRVSAFITSSYRRLGWAATRILRQVEQVPRPLRSGPGHFVDPAKKPTAIVLRFRRLCRDFVGPPFEKQVLIVKFRGYVRPHRAFEERRQVRHHSALAAAVLALG